jgi:hypothetical protein
VSQEEAVLAEYKHRQLDLAANDGPEDFPGQRAASVTPSTSFCWHRWSSPLRGRGERRLVCRASRCGGGKSSRCAPKDEPPSDGEDYTIFYHRLGL